MADIGTATVRVAPNMTGIQGKIAAGFKGSAGPATAALAGEVDKNSGPFQAALGKLGGFAKGAGIAIGAGLLAGAAGLATLTGKALMAGAELEQQLGGSEAVFGEYAKGIQDAAADAYKNAGLSQQEFLQGANKMGSLFQGAGIDVQKSMQLSADAMQRSSDIASIMGISTEAALEAVTGAAKGNFTMMDNLGVKMNDTSLSAAALQSASGGLWDKMNEGEKALFAQQYFMEKTAKYAGNYAKENETLSGSLNTTKKAFDNLLTGQGSVEGFIDSLINTINIAIPQIVTLLPKLVTAIGAILNAVVPALSAALPTLIPALIQAATDLILALVAAFPTIVSTLLQALPILIDAFIQLFLAILEALPQIIQTISDALPQIITAIVEGLTSPETLTRIIMGAIQLFLAIIKALPTIIVALVNALPVIINNIVKTVTSTRFINMLIQASIQLFLAIIKALPTIIVALVNALPTIINNIVRTLTSTRFINMMIQASIQLFLAIIRAVPQVLGSIGSAVGRIINTIGDTLSPGNMARIGTDMIRGLWNGISDMVGWISGKIRSFGASVMNGIKSFFGIHSPSRLMRDEVGKMLGEGIGVGILKSTKTAVHAAADSSAQIAKAFDTSPGIDITATAAELNSNANLYAGREMATNEEAGETHQVNVDTLIIEKDVDIDLVARKLGIKQLNSYRGVA